MDFSKETNRKHWNKIGSNYEKVWKSAGKKLLSNKETAYITSAVKKYKPISVLDIGCGTGRIIDTYISQPSVQHIYGIDLSDTMVRHCNQRFSNENKVSEILCADIEDAQIFSEKQFDMISAIRVLKYNASWCNMLFAIRQHLAPDGIFICTMPNILSVTALWPDDIEYTTPKKFTAALEQAEFRVLDMRGFSKLPDKLHTWANTATRTKGVNQVEKIAETAFGSVAGGRILFALCQVATPVSKTSSSNA